MIFAAFQKWVTERRDLTPEAREYLAKLERENAELRALIAALDVRVTALE